jgi:hypothetical protein
MCRLEKELLEDAACHRFYSTYKTSTVPRNLLKDFGDFKVGGQATHNVKCADGLALMDKEETVLHGTIDRLIEIGMCSGMEMNVEKTKEIRILKQLSAVQIMIVQK